jgi:hypothetical protein
MWNKKKSVCYPKKIKLFGHEIGALHVSLPLRYETDQL